MATKYIPTGFTYASPQMYVDIYPSTHGNPITLTPGNSGLRSLTVQKYIRGDNTPGRFTLELAPGGISGVNDPVTWTSLLPQYSMCVIYSARANSNAIVMVGLLSSITETQVWAKDKVERLIKIDGFDFTLYYTTFAYYVLSYLGLLNTLPSLLGPAGTAILNAGGEVSGDPAALGVNWFVNELVGSATAAPPTTGIAAKAVLDETTVPYRGSFVPLKNILTYAFESYTNLAGTPTIVPILCDWLISEGTFWDKFIAIFPFPFYEFFVNTVPSGYYSNEVKPQLSIQAQYKNYGSADVVTVARVNPLPCLDVNSSGNFVMRRDRWDALDLYSFDSSLFIESTVKYDIDGIKNFFVVAPMGPLTAPGGNPAGNLIPSLQQMGFMYDPDSVAKYGFRPDVESIIWWVDPFNVITAAAVTASGTTGQYPSIAQYESYLAKVASYYEPIPNMLSGMVRIPMWPEIIAGNRFEYAPFKNGIQYTFYITGIEHNFSYGGSSNTVLYIERGMPSSVYADTPAGILQAVHMGQVERQNGKFVIVGGGLVYKQVTEVDEASSFPPMGAYSGIGASPGNLGFPPNSTTMYDSLFQAAAASTTCGNASPSSPQYLDWRTVKALGITESGPGLNQLGPSSAGAVGVMQVVPALHPEYNPTLLATDPAYNIQAGANILCANLQSSGNIQDALAHYKGNFPNGYADPAAQQYVNPVIQIAVNAGVIFP